MASEVEITELRSEAESLAIALEFGIIDVADAVCWADDRIAESDVPHVALCDVSMSPKDYPQDVASLLRKIPGQFNHDSSIARVLQLALDTLKSQRRTPECVAKSLFDLVVAGALPPGELSDGAWWYWDAFDMARQGCIKKTAEEITHQMLSALSRAAGQRSS